MEIYERKVTTGKALKELEKLFNSLNDILEDDIINFNENEEFFCVVEHDNGFMCGDFNRREWITDTAKIGYRNGEFCLICYHSNDELNKYRINSDEFWRIKKINFAKMFTTLELVVKQYNERAKQKDEQIERFIEITSQF